MDWRSLIPGSLPSGPRKTASEWAISKDLGAELCNFQRGRREGGLGLCEGERRVCISSGQTCNVDRRASDFNVLGVESCNFRRDRREGRLGVGEGERRVSIWSDRKCNVDRRESNFNVLGVELCNFRRDRREGRLGVGEGERRVSIWSDRKCNVDRRASNFNVLGAELCNFRGERREGGLGEGERRVSISPGQACNVDRRASDFNVLGARLCKFRRERRDGRPGGMGEGEGRRRRGEGVSGLRGAGQAQMHVEAMIAVERGDEFHVRRESANVAVRELEVGMAKRPRQARNLQRGVALGRVARPFGERLVDFAPDRGEANPHRGRDLPMGIAGGDEVQKGLPALDALGPPRLGRGPRLGAPREG